MHAKIKKHYYSTETGELQVPSLKLKDLDLSLMTCCPAYIIIWEVVITVLPLVEVVFTTGYINIYCLILQSTYFQVYVYYGHLSLD
jgi:hypothetical protein